MKRLFPTLFLLALALSARAADIVTASITITNAAALTGTNGAALTVDTGTPDVRTWTNSVVTPAEQILASTNTATAASRLLIHAATYPFSGLQLGQIANGIQLRTAAGGTIDVTIDEAWGSVSYSTNTITEAVAVRIPHTVETAAVKTNIGNGLVNYLNLASTTTELDDAAAAMAQLAGLSNDQTFTGYKTFPNFGSGHSALTADNAATNFWVDLKANAYRTITAGGALNFQATTNRAAVRGAVVRIDPNGSDRALSWNTNWTFLGTAPTNIASGNIGILSLTSFGTAETDILAAYAVEGGGGSDTDDQTAAEVEFTPAGTLAATDVQAALEELDTEKAAAATTITVAGTANEITSSAGAQDLSANRTWTLSLPASIDLGGKTSFELPNAAAPTVDGFGEIAGDNDFFAAGRGALLTYDGTAATALVGVLVSDTPSNGQVPKWNTGGTITWEDDDQGAGGADATAIHDDTAGEIAAIADKATPVAADHLLIEDSADSNNKKDITIGSMEAALEGVMDLQDLQGAVTDAQVPDTITISAVATAAADDNDTSPASTAYVQGELTAYASDAVTFTAKTTSYSAALGSDDTYEGTQIVGLNNSGGVTQWDVVYLNSSSQWVLADANGSGTFPARGIASATVATGNATTVITSGTIRNDAWNWTIGGTVYLSTTAGGLTQTAPSTTGDTVQVIGFALTADIIAVTISPDYGTAP